MGFVCCTTEMQIQLNSEEKDLSHHQIFHPTLRRTRIDKNKNDDENLKDQETSNDSPNEKRNDLKKCLPIKLGYMSNNKGNTKEFNKIATIQNQLSKLSSELLTIQSAKPFTDSGKKYHSKCKSPTPISEHKKYNNMQYQNVKSKYLANVPLKGFPGNEVVNYTTSIPEKAIESKPLLHEKKTNLFYKRERRSINIIQNKNLNNKPNKLEQSVKVSYESEKIPNAQATSGVNNQSKKGSPQNDEKQKEKYMNMAIKLKDLLEKADVKPPKSNSPGKILIQGYPIS